MPIASTRLARLRRLALRRAAVILITHPPNLNYLIGFHGSNGVLALTRREAVFFASGVDRLQVRWEAVGVRLKVAAGDSLRAALRWLRRRRALRVAYEEEHVTVKQFQWMHRELGPQVKLVAAQSPVERLRAVKDAEEIARLRASLALTVRVFEQVLPYVRPGVRELDLAAEIEYRMKQQGARGPAFETIVVSGPRAALPHGPASPKRLARNELVVFDLGAILADYRSDMTRTVYLGTPSAGVKRLYGAVHEALERAREAVRAGVAAARVDAAARKHLARLGYERYFVHGNGLGLETHEEPRISKDGKARLAAGNVITLEPGVYLPGRGGVRLEDVVVVRRQGAELLTPISSELICL